MTSMVEKVARAVRSTDVCGFTLSGETVFCDDTRLLGELDGNGKPLYVGDCRCKAVARAAIEAMREPTEEMERAHVRAYLDGKNSLAQYRAAIDASLTPQENE